MRTPEQIFDEAIEAKGLDIVSVKDADLYEAGLDAIRQALSISNVVGRSEQLCDHPRSERSYIGQNMLRCNKCGKEFS